MSNMNNNQNKGFLAGLTVFFNKKDMIFVYALIVLIISYCVFFVNYNRPKAVIWDENYHIVSAQKYIDGVFFMECHPPLGKLLIALGEALINPNKNIDRSSFLSTDYISNTPENYSFRGVRFVPVLLAMLSAALFLFVLFLLFDNAHLAFFFSFLYIFDNAAVIHSRAAMLDGIQMFFILLAVLYFAYLIKKGGIYKLYDYLVMGILTGLAITVKVNSAVILLLFVFLVFKEYSEEIFKFKIFKLRIFSVFLIKTCLSIIGIIIPVFIVFFIHFNISKTVINGKYYHASGRYKEILNRGHTANPLNFFVMFRDYKKFMDVHHAGVPKLDPSNPKENGSHPIGWPLGIKSINYRWDKAGDNQNRVKYLTIQSNPVIWLSGLLGIMFSIMLIGGVLFFNLQIRNKDIFYKILMFSILYVFYMTAILQIPRVMYLYHYLLPLIFALIVFYLIIIYIFEEMIQKQDIRFYICIAGFFLIVFAVFIFFKPFTYHEPITAQEYMMRVWTNIWGLKPPVQ